MLVDLIRIGSEELRKGRGQSLESVSQSAAHGYYTHLKPKTGQHNTVPVKRVRKDGVVQVYWVAKDPLKNKKHMIASFKAGDHSHEAFMQKLTDEHGYKPTDILHLERGDTVTMTDGQHKGKMGVVKAHLANEKNPSPRISVWVPAIIDAQGKPIKWKAVTVNVNDIALVKKGADHDPNEVKPKPKKEKEGVKIEPLLPQTQHEMAERAIAVHSIYKRTSDGASYILESIIDDGSVRLAPITPGLGWKEAPLAVFKHALKKGMFKRLPPSPPVAALHVLYPNTFKLESGELHEKGLISFDAEGEPVASEEARKILGEVVAEHIFDLQKRVYNDAIMYKGLSQMDVEDIMMDSFEILVNRLVKYEPFIGNKAGGVQAFLYEKIVKTIDSKAYFKAKEKEKIIMQGSHLVGDQGVVPEDTKQEPEYVMGGGAFSAASTLQELAEGLRQERKEVRKFFRDVIFHESAKYTGPANKVAGVFMGWVGLGQLEPEDSRDEAAEKLAGYIKKNGEPFSKETVANLLTTWKHQLRKAWSWKSEADPEFAAMGIANIKLRLKARNKYYEPMEYVVEKVPGKPAPVDHSLGAKHSIEKLIMSHPMAPQGENAQKDLDNLVRLVQGLYMGQYTPFDLARPKVLPPQYIDVLSDTVHSMGGSLMKTNTQGDLYKVDLKSDILNAIIARNKYKAAMEAEISKWLFDEKNPALKTWAHEQLVKLQAK